jgi:Fic family protein
MPLSSDVRLRQGLLLGRIKEYGFHTRQQATVNTITEETIKSSAIEGIALNPESVRSSLARRLGLEAGGLRKEDRNVEGVVQMMLDATQKYTEPLTVDRLFLWHSYLFPGPRTTADTFRVGVWRNDAMQVISGPHGHRKVHYEAPAASRLEVEMSRFLDWFNTVEHDPLLKAAIAHLWFVTIHPFDDGNGRIARAISEMALARSDQSKQRFYSMSSQILEERNGYYEVLENTQKGSLDISDWIVWFLKCLGRAIDKANLITDGALKTEALWRAVKQKSIEVNDRQKKILNKLLQGFDGKLTSEKWARMTKVSHNTAIRDISSLIAAGILRQDSGGGRSTSYSLEPQFR